MGSKEQLTSGCKKRTSGFVPLCADVLHRERCRTMETLEKFNSVILGSHSGRDKLNKIMQYGSGRSSVGGTGGAN